MTTYDYILENRTNKQRVPSVKTLEAAFPGKGKALRKLFTDNLAVWNHEACQIWLTQCYNQPSLNELRLCALNAEIDCHGVEYIPGTNTRKTPSIDYCNAGDLYNTTIMLLNDNTWRVGCVGDIVERGNYE